MIQDITDTTAYLILRLKEGWTELDQYPNILYLIHLK